MIAPPDTLAPEASIVSMGILISCTATPEASPLATMIPNPGLLTMDVASRSVGSDNTIAAPSPVTAPTVTEMPDPSIDAILLALIVDILSTAADIIRPSSASTATIKSASTSTSTALAINTPAPYPVIPEADIDIPDASIFSESTLAR